MNSLQHLECMLQISHRRDSMKIQEIIVEPTKVKVGSTFRLKVKTINYLTYKEMKTKNYKYFKNYKYKNLKGA